ncbi:MAG TPA: hypothetical protein PLJ21_08820 [Pseudobdellovibrionaceae bacterium]|nr:hypothetical protein [Pseudobdellovibrionaceae bacterium]
MKSDENMEFHIWRIGKGWFDLEGKIDVSLFSFQCTSNNIQNVLSKPKYLRFLYC